MRSLYHGWASNRVNRLGNWLPGTRILGFFHLAELLTSTGFPGPGSDLPLTRTVIYRTLASRLFARSYRIKSKSLAIC